MARQRGAAQRDRRSGSSRALSRRERERRERHTERLIVYGAGAVLTVVVVLVAIGLYITQYRPPRAHVLTVGDRDYNAAQVARRATFEVLRGGVSSNGDVVGDTLLRIEDMEVVLARAPESVGEVSDADVEKELRTRLGFEDTAGQEDDAYGDALATLLRSVALNRDEYERVVSSEILLDRLAEPVREQIGESGLQFHLSRIRVADRGVAEEIRQLVLDGADFAELATERTTESDRAQDGGELGWFPPGAMSDEVRTAVADLHAGEVSEVVEVGAFFDVYFVSEREDDREYEDDQIDALVARDQRQWIDDQSASVEVETDLSSGERSWILDRVSSDVSERIAAGSGS